MFFVNRSHGCIYDTEAMPRRCLIVWSLPRPSQDCAFLQFSFNQIKVRLCLMTCPSDSMGHVLCPLPHCPHSTLHTANGKLRTLSSSFRITLWCCYILFPYLNQVRLGWLPLSQLFWIEDVTILDFLAA